MAGRQVDSHALQGIGGWHACQPPAADLPSTGRLDHVQVMTKSKNVYLAAVVDLQDGVVDGHHLLDLSERCGVTRGGG